MKKVFNCIKKNYVLIIFELISLLFMIMMAEWIVNSSGKKYTLEGKEPELAAECVVMGQDGFRQELQVEEDRLYGVVLLVAHNEDTSTRKISFKVTNLAGNELEYIEKDVDGTHHYETILFDDYIDTAVDKRIILDISASNELLCLGATANENLINQDSNLHIKGIYSYVNSNKFLDYIYVIVLVFWLAVSVFFVAIYRKVKAENLFAILYFIIGLGYLIIMPLSSVPDEMTHFLRSYEISEGNLISVKIQGDDGKEFVGRELPSALCINWNGPDAKWKDGENWKNIVIEEENKSFIEFPNTALYSPFTYLPQVLGISIGKILTNKVIIIAYMGRVLSWLAVGLIMYLTIKYIPMGKMLLTVVTLLPMNMQECISLAADGFTYAICTAFIAFVLYMRYGYNGKMKKKHFVILYVLLFFISTVKIVYMPLCLLAFLIPVQRFGDKRSYFKHAGLAALLAITTCLVWFIISSNILVTFNPGADSDAHLQHIIKAPMEYIRILFGTVISEFDFYLKMMVGAYLGWLNINQNALIVDLSIALIIIVLVKEKYSINSNVSIKPVRVISAIAVFSIILLMFTSLYIQWTPVSSSIITGVQGRYFLPLIFPTALMIKSYCFEKEDRINGSDTNLLMSMSALCIVVINICAFISMSTFFVI